ncbi:prephenate dehydrogenase [Lysobacter sp. LF1]|uniref:Prephenate dehydrogenase n=1 Tax=Lysobacter stagni TaxID=3045172 RepID=A0ABT6XHT4_9GAMM|nr:prephenate dehydrogenase [Lysobacter sp. LF1]MDI9239707.1 prephenate dehydrogenase [Lysobacter sp. LF1]
MSAARDPSPVVGIVGIHGAYGRWLRAFFEDRMGLQVVGHDPAGEDTLPPHELVRRADVLIFSTPIRHTPAVIRQYVALADGVERGRLWMDLTSTKHTPVTELLHSQAEVVGLHPMCAPPKTPTLKGRVMAVCPARLDAWRDWLADFLARIEAECVSVEPSEHDRAMALIQGLVHAAHMAQADVLRELAPSLGGLDRLRPLRTVGYELDLTVTERILSGNPAIYEDIQFENPHVLPALDRFAEAIEFLRTNVRRGGDEARHQVRSRLLARSADFFGTPTLVGGSHGFERLGYLLVDLESPDYLSVFLPEDRPGSLRALLAVFERLGVNLASIHSSRTPDGELHFRIGLDAAQVAAMSADELSMLGASIEAEGIGRVLSGCHLRRE